MDFSIKGDNVLVKIDVLNRPYPDGDNYWDINWLICSIYIKIPGFIADFSTYIRSDELKSFYDGLMEMHEKLHGNAILATLENEIFIECKIDKLGKIEWIVEASYSRGTMAEFRFEFENEQSYLYETLKNLKDITEEFPIINV